MKTRDYIESGVLEAYLLGIATEDEQQEVRQLAALHPEIALALSDLEVQIEQVCQEGAIPPPPAVWDGIEARIRGDLRRYEPPVETPPIPEGPGYVRVEVDDTHIRVHKYWRPAFIAVFILSKIFLILGLYFYFKSDSQNQEIERLKLELNESRTR